MNIKSVSKPIVIITAVSAVAFSVGNYVWDQEHRPKKLEIYAFALDKGHAIFIRTPEDKRILINGGFNSEIVNKLTGVLPFYSKRIDMVFVTNPIDNEVSGLIDILDRYRVDKVYLPAVTLQSLGLASSTGVAYEIFNEKLKLNNIEIENLSHGRKVVLDGEVYADVLFPALSDEFRYSKSSAPEVIINIKYRDDQFLLLGGASVKIQKYIASSSLISTLSSVRMLGRSYSTVLFVNGSAMPANIANKLVEALKPDHLVYSKVYSSVGKVSKTKSKVPVDPLNDISGDHRFNLKEYGDVHITTDGRELTFIDDLK